MLEPRRKIFWFAIISRCVVLLLQMVFNLLCPDHNADAFRTPPDTTEKAHLPDRLVSLLLGGLTRWDAQYFIHIAKYGYTYENTLAFYPLFPWTMGFVASKLRVVPPILNHSSAILVSGAVLNFVCFVKAALVLYDLTVKVFRDERVAYRSAVLFCVNPASIFFSALYTEASFAFLTFYCMLESLSGNPCVFLPLSLSTLVRSNGLVNIGFPVYTWLKSLLTTSIPNCISEYKLYHSNKYSLLFNSRHILISLSQILTLGLTSLLPFCGLQMYYYATFCKPEANATAFPYHVQQHALENGLLLSGRSESVWCAFKIPLAYSYIQSKYWNVGFMRYYQFKQIPNFVLALPVLYLVLRCIVEFFAEHMSKFCSLEFYTGSQEKKKKPRAEMYPLEMFVFAVHGAFLALTCVFFVHIQVSTRMLCSATPLLYWYCALLTLREVESSGDVKPLEYESPENMFSKWKVFFITQRRYTTREKMIYGYFLGYAVLGCFMFSNFLPWT